MDSITFILHISENTSFGRFSATALERRPIAESAMEERDIMREIIKGKGMVSDPASTGQLSLRGDLHLEIPIEPKDFASEMALCRRSLFILASVAFRSENRYAIRFVTEK